MSKFLSAIFATFVFAAAVRAQQIGVNPTGVNVNAHGATSVFLTYGPIRNYIPAEACWAGELIAAAPDPGLKPDPATILGCLPARYDHSTASQMSAFTDVMSIPPSVALRAYQAAVGGADSRFFYVRRFASTVGGPSQFVAVTCRLTGGGARTPFSLTDVRLSFDVDTPVLLVKPGEPVPKVKAHITYTGTGRLKGRWEVVKPGDEAPSETDLLTEATLPIERRGSQKRFSQLSRFDVFLPPVGRYTVAGPDPSLLPDKVEGPYLILLRLEASDDKEGDSDLSAVGVGSSIVHSGGVAGFSMPGLRYFVGSGTEPAARELTLLSPNDNETRPIDVIEFRWSASARASLCRLDLTDDGGVTILSALLLPAVKSYRPPSWVKDRTASGSLRWRVAELDGNGNARVESNWRVLRLVGSR